MYRTDFWTLWEKARVGCFERTALKHVYYLGWNRSSAQVGCMRQVLGPGALGRPRGIGWRGRWEAGSGWGIHVNPWLIHVNVWQNPVQYCKVISLQIIIIIIIIRTEKMQSPNATCQFWLHLHFFFNWAIKNISEGVVPRWWRNRTGKPLSPQWIHQKIIWMLSNVHKTTSGYWRRTPGTQKGSPIFSKEGRTKY